VSFLLVGSRLPAGLVTVQRVSRAIDGSDGPALITASVASACCVRRRDEDDRLGKKLYVGNLPFTASEDEIRELFERHGAVDKVSVITDRETGRPRGFAFVEMGEGANADAAIQALDGRDFGGRSLRVNEAQDRRGGGGGGGGYGGGGGGGGRGGYGGGGGGRSGGGGGYGGGGGGGGRY
jgi:cold-inducible RNA-binding protein